MPKTFTAIYDGKVLCPEESLNLEPNTVVQVTIEISKKTDKCKKSFLQTARSLNIDGPPDWSDKLDNYLYGMEKNSDE